MAYTYWKRVSESPVPFAGVTHFATFTIHVDHEQSGLCLCKSTKGRLVKITIDKLLGKDRKPCGYHSAREVKKVVLDRFADKQYRCIDCLQQPPFIL